MSAHRLWMKSGASGRAVYFNHPAIEDNCDERAHNRHGEADHPRFQHQGKKFSEFFRFQFRGNGSQGRRYINTGVRVDDPGALLHNGLRHLKNCDDKVECMVYDVDRDSRLDNPLEENECVEVVHIVFIYDHVDQLIGQDRGNYKARDGDDYRLGQAVNHGEDAGVPFLRRLSNFPCDSSDLGIYIAKHIR